MNAVLNRFLAGFNRVFDRLSSGYGTLVRGLLRVSVVLLVIYGGLLAMTALGFKVVPKGFIPDQDKGYLVVNVQLPDGASLERTDRLVTELGKIALGKPKASAPRDCRSRLFHALEHESQQRGRDVRDPGALSKSARNTRNCTAGACRRIAAEVRCLPGSHDRRFRGPARRRPGSTGGIKLQIQDKRDAGLRSLQGAVEATADEGHRQPGIAALISTFSVNQPQVFVEIDRDKAKAQSVSLDDVNNTLQSYLGSYYVNDFTFQNRSWQVNIQADPKYRMRVEDIGRLEVRNAKGDRVPLATLIHVKDTSGPAIVNHYNLYPSAEITGILAPGTSSRQGIEIMDGVARDQLPSTMGYEWTELSFQELMAEKDLLAKLVFPLAVLFVFMVLAAQYESWSLPLAILLIVPMCVLSALIGLWMVAPRQQHLRPDRFRGLDRAGRQERDSGGGVRQAVGRCGQEPAGSGGRGLAHAAAPDPHDRLCLHSRRGALGDCQGRGAEMRVPLGVAVFSGMLGVTFFGLIFTPVFYSIIMRFGGKGSLPTSSRPKITTTGREF